MGTGKTSVGKILAAKMARPFVDIDSYIEAEEKKRISQIFEERGEQYFREIESRILSEMVRRSGMVLVTGGGAVIKEENRDLLRQNAVVVSLRATPETIYKRVKDSLHRPLLNGQDQMGQIVKLYDARKKFYDDADVIIETDHKASKEVADEILAVLKEKYHYAA